MGNTTKFIPFDDIVDWQEKSKIKSGDGKATGKYKMFICSDTETKRFDSYLINKEALVFGTGGKASIHYCSEPFAYSTDCVVAVLKNNNFNLKFIYYYFRQKNMFLLQKDFTGSGLQHTSKKKIGKILIPVLPLKEQEKIVFKIETLFSKLDKSVSELKLAKKKLNVYRQAVLKEAFEQCKNSISVESVCEHITDGDHMPPPKSSSGIPFIMISNIKNNKIMWENTNFVTKSYYNSLDEKHTPKAGDILYTVTGSYGIPVMICDNNSFCFQRHIALLRPNKKITQTFLYYALQTPQVYIQATKNATGTAQKTVGLTVLRKIKIPFENNKDIQRNIVDYIEKNKLAFDSILQVINISLEQAKLERQSILKNAFEGGTY